MQRGGAGELLLRVGDAERDACSAVLIDHHLHGRLSVDELEQRQRMALDATTADDLRRLLADLPTDAARTGPSRIALPSGKPGTTISAGRWLLPIGTVLGGASFSQWAWQYSAEGPFLGALAGGALGYAVHAAVSRFRR
jgi:hypothetical protein